MMDGMDTREAIVRFYASKQASKHETARARDSRI